MNAGEWIALGSLVILIIINIGLCAYYFGDIRGGVKSLVERGERTDARADTHELRLNDHTRRIGRIEGKIGLDE